MRRTGTYNLAFVLLILFGGTLLGCDQSPTSVEDLEIQPALDSPSTLSLSLVGEPTASFNVTYQGFDAHPAASGLNENLTVEKVSQDGSPSEGEQQWTASFNGEISGIIQDSIAVTGNSSGREIADTVQVTISPFSILTQPQNNFVVIEDYESDARSFSTTEGTTARLDTLNDLNQNASAGFEYLTVNSAPSGSATVTRRTNAAGADRFSFLIQQGSSEFDLTLTFTEETGVGTATHDFTVPVQAGEGWVRYQVGLDQVSSDFNPVASRSGGDGPFVEVSLSTSEQVTFSIDEFRFASPNGVVAEIHDFEDTNLAYGPPFNSSADFQLTSNVVENSGGFNGQTIDGSGFFGYNFNSLGSDLDIEVDANDVLTFRARSQSGADLLVFLQTPDGVGGFEGEGTGATRALPTGGWQTVEIPVGELGDSPAALNNPGISNVGFVLQGDDDIGIDDIRIESRE